MYPEPLFEIFGRGVYLYGICIAVGIAACFALLIFTMSKLKFNDYSSNVIVIIGVLSTGIGFLFAALFQATYNYIANPSAGFHLGESITFLGGLIGGAATFIGLYLLFMKVIRPRNTVKFFSGEMNATLSDALPFIPIGIVVAHAFGRLGCFFAGCCYGVETDAWFGLPCSMVDNANRVPTQLFEMIFLFILAAVMALLFYRNKFNYNFSVYMIAYGIWRFVLEFFRGDGDARGKFLGDALYPSQIWSIVLVIVGVAYIFLYRKFFAKSMLHPERVTAAATEGSSETVTEGANAEGTAVSADKPVSPVVPKEPAPEKQEYVDEDD
ncbi:MAG: prolipoprotein diacylglyceryl transferase [Clostridiales bacterium]|nr:prolipoprotein diacylglyceryl transferase [Clostridiales bacterium]